MTTDDDIALLFADRHSGEVCYDVEAGEWLVWDHRVPPPPQGRWLNDRVTDLRPAPRPGAWVPDGTMKIERLIRDTCRDVANAADPKMRPRLLTFARVRAVERLARCDDRLALSPLERQPKAEARRRA
jgi:hypothetical protein